MYEFIDYKMIKEELNLKFFDAKEYSDRELSDLWDATLSNKCRSNKQEQALKLLEKDPKKIFETLETRDKYKKDYLVFYGETSKRLLNIAIEEQLWGIIIEYDINNRFFKDYSYEKLLKLADKTEYKLSYDFYINNYLDNDEIKKQIAYLYVSFLDKLYIE